MPRALPTYPTVLFGLIEPALLIWAYISILSSPESFYLSQHPYHPASPFPPQAEILVLLLANVYLLLAALAVVCCFTSSKTVAKGYLAVVAAADIGHIWAVYRVFGYERFIAYGAWNDATWGNVGVSAFLHVNRLATLLGAFGRVGK